MSESNKEKLFDLDVLSIPDFADVSDSLFQDGQTPQSEGTKYIVFMINEVFYAIASKKVSEVVRPIAYTSLPNIPEWFLGIANLRGGIISIVDLQTLWGLKPSESSKSKLVVLRSDNAESQIAFKVDKLREIVTLPDSDIETVNDVDTPYIIGNATLKAGSINIIDIDTILSSLAIAQQT